MMFDIQISKKADDALRGIFECYLFATAIFSLQPESLVK